jgi:hypothetical protein
LSDRDLQEIGKLLFEGLGSQEFRKIERRNEGLHAEVAKIKVTMKLNETPEPSLQFS